MATDDPIMETRLALAEIKGMLSVITSSHSETLSQHGVKLGEHENRLNGKGKDIATLQERNRNHTEDIKELKENDKGQAAKNIAVAGFIFTSVVSLIAIFNFVSNTGVLP